MLPDSKRRMLYNKRTEHVRVLLFTRDRARRRGASV